MLRLVCPFCGPRNEIEFVCGGEATRRPDGEAVLDPAALSAQLYERDNIKGPHVELWWHKHGCRRWFPVTRDTRDNVIAP